MPEIQGGIEGQLGFLTEQVELLRKEVDGLSARLLQLESMDFKAQETGEVRETATVIREPRIAAKEGVLRKAGTGSLLPRVATACFIMVVALILRTITDNGIINTQLGSILGMGYATALILVGGWFYLRKSSLAPVFPAFGLLLLFSIVIETHARFQSISTVTAYLILMVVGVVVTTMGLRHRAPFQLYSAALGTGLVGMTIDFPYPVYPLLGLIIFGGCVAAYIAWKAQICQSLRWTTLGLAMIFFMFWSFKLNSPIVHTLVHNEQAARENYLSWFLPFLFLFWIFFIVINIIRMSSDREEHGFYESLLPTVISTTAFMAALSVILPWYHNTLWLGIVGILVAFGHLGVAAWLAKKNTEGAFGCTSYTFPAVLLMSLGVATIFSSGLWAVPVLSVSAYIMVRGASKWQSGGVRCTSYLFQAAALLVALATGIVAVDIDSPMIGGLLTGTMMIMSFLQYRWSRNHEPPSVHSAFFSWLDKRDFSAVILLLTGLVNGFFLLRLGLYQMLILSSSGFEFMFRGGQTVFINLGAVALLLYASSRKNREILTVAIVVGILGLGRSFVFDLLGIKGMPLVLSIFSSGLVAAVGSVVSTRWQGKKDENLKHDPMTVQMEGRP